MGVRSHLHRAKDRVENAGRALAGRPEKIPDAWMMGFTQSYEKEHPGASPREALDAGVAHWMEQAQMEREVSESVESGLTRRASHTDEESRRLREQRAAEIEAHEHATAMPPIDPSAVLKESSERTGSLPSQAAMLKSRGLIHLQGIGNVKAVRWGDVRKGDKVLFNQGVSEEVVDWEPTGTGSVRVWLKSSSGEVFQTTRRENALIGKG